MSKKVHYKQNVTINEIFTVNEQAQINRLFTIIINFGATCTNYLLALLRR